MQTLVNFGDVHWGENENARRKGFDWEALLAGIKDKRDTSLETL